MERLQWKVLGCWRSDAGCRAFGAGPTLSSNWEGARTKAEPGKWQKERIKTEDLQILWWGRRFLMELGALHFLGSYVIIKESDVSQHCNAGFSCTSVHWVVIWEQIHTHNKVSLTKPTVNATITMVTQLKTHSVHYIKSPVSVECLKR